MTKQSKQLPLILLRTDPHTTTGLRGRPKTPRDVGGASASPCVTVEAVHVGRLVHNDVACPSSMSQDMFPVVAISYEPCKLRVCLVGGDEVRHVGIIQVSRSSPIAATTASMPNDTIAATVFFREISLMSQLASSASKR